LGSAAEHEFTELLHGQNTDVAEMMQALRKFLGENDMMAYLTMMANRLVELPARNPQPCADQQPSDRTFFGATQTRPAMSAHVTFGATDES
jgi:hypothetical protein